MGSSRRPGRASSTLRLLVYTQSREFGGAEQALGYLLGALAPEISVGVLCTTGAVGEALAACRTGVPVILATPPSGLRDRRALAEHVRAVRRFAPGILHANQAWPWDCAYGELAGMLTPGVRVLAVDHLALDSPVPRRRRIGRQLLARRLDAHVAVGERAARMIERFVGLPPDSVTSVPNGVPSTTPQPLPSPAAGPIVGSLGRLVEQKGFDLLIRALPRLPGATLVLVGDGPQRDTLVALAESLGVSDRLLITGWSREARRYLPTFDIFALPSRWEGMPLSILEAMHAGLPVLAADVASVSEVVLDGETGFVVAPEDQDAICDRLQRLLGDASLRARMGERGRARAAERFTDLVMAARYEDIYSALTSA